MFINREKYFLVVISLLCAVIFCTCSEDENIVNENNDSPPIVTVNKTLNTTLGMKLCDSIDIDYSDIGNNSKQYKILGFDGPTSFGGGLQLDTVTGKWCWDIDAKPEYLGYFELSIAIFDGINICDTCIPANSDTAYYDINVTGFEISIEVVHDQLQGHYAEVSIYLDSAYMPDFFCCNLLGGFDFLIAYDNSALTALSVAPGALIDNGKFEYFTYRFGAFGNCVDGCPSGMLRIVSMREENDGVINPYHVTGPGELAVMSFFVSGDYNLEGQFVPIQFYWIDCGDNTFSDELGDWFYLGMNVYDDEGMEFVDPTEIFGYSGPEDYCSNSVFLEKQTAKSTPFPAIKFRNGGVGLIPVQIIDDRGDINLNGIPNEIADAVVFTNYFIYGPSAFTINFEGQKAATEVNGDGIALTVADLVYLIRIIVGDALPAPQVNPDAFAKFTRRHGTIRVKTNADIGAVLLVFDAPVTPSLATDAGHMEMLYNRTASTTRVIIYSFDMDHAITTGDLLEIDGVGGLVSVEAAEYRGVTLKVMY